MCWAETAATGCGLTNDYQVMKGQNLGYRGRVENSASAACSPFLLRTYMLPPSLPMPRDCGGAKILSLTPQSSPELRRDWQGSLPPLPTLFAGAYHEGMVLR